MADNTADKVAPASATGTDAKAPETNDSLPAITKEPAGTADASMVPSASAATDTLAAKDAATSSADTAKPEEAASKDSVIQPDDACKDKSDTDSSALKDATAASGLGAAIPNGQPKPVAIEEVTDQDMPSTKLPESADAPTVTTGVETAKVPAVTGDEAAIGDKRKADEADKPVSETTADEPADKKQKTETNGAATTNGGARKPGRPKKEKGKAAAAPAPAAPIGRTARKTRSQGLADA
ncbi:hypothetical protein GGR57DRAFT_503725 [Xylariaceae sp. FL1272]|nr:hypothetical protein GGR57DRAFT_503725 [Xylariaceae sp. FL1272]